MGGKCMHEMWFEKVFTVSCFKKLRPVVFLFFMGTFRARAAAEQCVIRKMCVCVCVYLPPCMLICNAAQLSSLLHSGTVCSVHFAPVCFHRRMAAADCCVLTVGVLKPFDSVCLF